MLASLYETQIKGTSPLYLYSNDNSERLSFESDLSGGMVRQRVIGYCYKEQFLGYYDELIEISDGTRYQYVLNNKSNYSDSWKETGVRIYTKKIG